MLKHRLFFCAIIYTTLISLSSNNLFSRHQPTTDTENSEEFSEFSCAICCEACVPGETVFVHTKCFHYFHIGCLDWWLSEERFSLNPTDPLEPTACPTCEG